MSIVGVVPIRLPAWLFLGGWFLYQLVLANFGLFAANGQDGGVAFFAHVGGFVFGVAVALFFSNRERVADGAPVRTAA
jgi:membrane associated rhomboid family serine protease